jgi:hypothetical protein
LAGSPAFLIGYASHHCEAAFCYTAQTNPRFRLVMGGLEFHIGIGKVGAVAARRRSHAQACDFHIGKVVAQVPTRPHTLPRVVGLQPVTFHMGAIPGRRLTPAAGHMGKVVGTRVGIRIGKGGTLLLMRT